MPEPEAKTQWLVMGGHCLENFQEGIFTTLENALWFVSCGKCCDQRSEDPSIYEMLPDARLSDPVEYEPHNYRYTGSNPRNPWDEGQPTLTGGKCCTVYRLRA